MQHPERVIGSLVCEATELTRASGSFLARQARLVASQAAYHRRDIAVMAGVSAAASAYAVWAFHQLDFIHLASYWDSWFDADVRRIVGIYTSRFYVEHARTTVHPLHSLVSAPFFVLKKLGLDAHTVAAVLVAFGAFAFTSMFYAAARTMRLLRIDAVLITFLMLSTSASIFWLPIPETYPLGAASMLLALVWLGIPRGEHDHVTGPLQSIVALSVTITNWSAGILAAVLALGVRRAISITLAAFAITVILSGIQQYAFPPSGKLFDFAAEQTYRDPLRHHSTGEGLAAFAGQSLLAPKLKVDRIRDEPPNLGVLYISAIPSDLSPTAWAAVAGWAALLLLGVAGAFRGRVPQRSAIFVLSMLAGQVILHSLYGTILFLYSLHFTPFIVLIVGFASTLPWRKTVLSLVALTALLTFSHNINRFQTGAQLLPAVPVNQEFADKYLK